MAQRRFGPTLGAGVVVIEKEAEKILEAAALGVTGYVGILERGDTGKLLQTFSKKGMTAKIGGRIEESAVPDCGIDFWDHSNGAGELHFVRVTDGTERKAEITLWSREASPVQVAKLRAHNGGRWGGRLQAIVGEMTLVSTDLTQTTLATGKTFLVDEWKGAKLTLDAVGAKSYEVVSNTALGVLTVKSDSKMVSNITLSCFVKPSAYANLFLTPVAKAYRPDASGWSSPYTSVQLYFNNNSTPSLGGLVNIAGVQQAVPIASNVLKAAGQWNHVGLTYDGTTIKLYANGVLVSTKAQTGNIDWGTHGPWWIGGNISDTETLTGVVEEVRLANVVRNADWFAQVSANGLSVNQPADLEVLDLASGGNFHGAGGLEEQLQLASALKASGKLGLQESLGGGAVGVPLDFRRLNTGLQ